MVFSNKQGAGESTPSITVQSGVLSNGRHTANTSYQNRPFFIRSGFSQLIRKAQACCAVFASTPLLTFRPLLG